ncbi:MAG: acylphosphatase [Candidatus Brockarchaeota archaeon]|nr:acylphosphatase [Candidatus Brockarchaeota archaeon]
MGKGRVLIRGSRVQDVGYRLFLLNLASESNLTGFQARNVDTDCVEALYEGGEEETKMFVEKVRELAPKEQRSPA